MLVYLIAKQNYIDKTSNKQLKKIGVELALIAIKLARISGKVITKFLSGLGWFLRLILKTPSYGILGKIYYAIFRFKKNNLGHKTPLALIREKTIYIFIVLLSLLLIISNLFYRDVSVSLETKMPKTVMANIVKNEFGDLSQEKLIEEIATPNIFLTIGKEKYENDICTLKKSSNLVPENNPEESGLIEIAEEGDVIFKPSTANPGTIGNDNIPAQRSAIIYYTVQNGDTVSSIARKFGLNANTILWANNLGAFSLIRPGDSLTILPASGVLYTVKRGDTLAKIAQKYDLEIEKIISFNNLGNTLAAGEKIILPGAKRISETVASSRPQTNTSYTGLSVIKNLIKSPAAPASGSKMTWPTSGYRISQYFSWRHTGVDIANKVGTPIYAAGAGVVITAQGGWNGGYGNTIVIDHGGGKKTRYGHLSKLFVKVGEEVERGENIGTMGSTGRSTGSHLHFEVIINGTKYNPLSYIK